MSLFYQADLLRGATSTDEFIASCYVTRAERTLLGYPGHADLNADDGNRCTVSTGMLSNMRKSITVSFDGLDEGLTGTFHVRLRGCVEVNSVTWRCGGYGTDGDQVQKLPAVAPSRSLDAPPVP